MWNKYKIVVFILTFVCFSLFHATRKGLSNVKNVVSNEWTPVLCNKTYPCPLPNKTWHDHRMFSSYKACEPFLGLLDTCFMFAYALGLYVSGFLADRIELRKVLSIGMCLSGILDFSFGYLLEFFHYYHKYLYVILWTLNGLAQSTGWPCCVAIMGNWFGKSHRGLLFGIWSACASFGNIYGALIISATVDYGYDKAFLVTSFALFCGGVVAFFGIINSPEEVGLANEDPEEIEQSENLLNGEMEENLTETEDSIQLSDDKVEKPESNGINFISAFCLPGVALYSVAYACLKLVNYGFFFWLPYYLTNKFMWGDSKADKLSTWYDLGGIIGGIGFGLLSDFMKKRSPVLVTMLIITPFTIWIYQNSPNNVTINCFLMAIVGVFIGGAANIISSAVAADLGKQRILGRNTKALATVTGIIDGTGSIGAALGQYLVAVIQVHLGWHFVFYFFILMIILTLIFILPLLRREVNLGQLCLCCNNQQCCIHHRCSCFCNSAQ